MFGVRLIIQFFLESEIVAFRKRIIPVLYTPLWEVSLNIYQYGNYEFIDLTNPISKFEH